MKSILEPNFNQYFHAFTISELCIVNSGGSILAGSTLQSFRFELDNNMNSASETIKFKISTAYFQVSRARSTLLHCFERMNHLAAEVYVLNEPINRCNAILMLFDWIIFGEVTNNTTSYRRSDVIWTWHWELAWYAHSKVWRNGFMYGARVDIVYIVLFKYSLF